MNALLAAAATVNQRRRSNAGTASAGVSLVAMARPSRTPPRIVRRVVRAVASTRIAAAAIPAATTSTWALLPASRATIGHQDHSAAVRMSRRSRLRPNSSSTVMSTATSAVVAWIGLVELLANGRKWTPRKDASATGGELGGTGGRPVDGRAAGGEFGGRMVADIGLGDAVLGPWVEEELVAQAGELPGRGHVLVRIDARGLHPAVPDVAVEVVAVLRGRGHRGELDGDAAEHDEHDRGPQRHLPQQPGGGDEREPRADEQRQRPYPRGIVAGTDEQQDQAGHHHQGQADRDHAKFCVHAA